MFFLLHVTSMSLALIAVCTGIFMAMFLRKNPAWLRRHQALGAAGLVCALAGFVSIIMGISLSRGEHFGVPHTWLGLAVIALILITPLTGRLQLAAGAQGPTLRPWHIWAGRTAPVLMAVNMVLGIALLF